MPGGNLNKEIFLNTVKSDAANGEYYSAAEPPVRYGESHLSGPTEPPIDSYSA